MTVPAFTAALALHSFRHGEAVGLALQKASVDLLAAGDTPVDLSPLLNTMSADFGKELRRESEPGVFLSDLFTTYLAERAPEVIRCFELSEDEYWICTNCRKRSAHAPPERKYFIFVGAGAPKMSIQQSFGDKDTAMRHCDNELCVHIKETKWEMHQDRVYGDCIIMDIGDMTPTAYEFVITVAGADYMLTGACLYRGNRLSGHYIAYVNYHGAWWLANDSRVRRKQQEDVFGDAEWTPKVLLYQKQR